MSLLKREELEEVFRETKKCGDCLRVYEVKTEPSGIVKVICPYDKEERYTNSECSYVKEENDT